MKEENFIHIKLDYGEALQAKKDILFSEMDLLKTLKIIRKYHELRQQELELKQKFRRRVKEIETAIKKTETLLPKVKMPEILKKEEPLEFIKPTKTERAQEKKKKTYSDEIEDQLEEIKNKLKSLE